MIFFTHFFWDKLTLYKSVFCVFISFIRSTIWERGKTVKIFFDIICSQLSDISRKYFLVIFFTKIILRKKISRNLYHTKKLYSIPKMDNYDQIQILTRNPIYNFNWFLWIFPIKDMTTQLRYFNKKMSTF